ncbi:hypothetical protein L21SP5_00985 [Salinivirga cyanobacteriivorans]|uniref:Uncharacterized protein n=1 Tax=Salinivirga cyanobacteriivorans TaxID=1307839 RepID=A0A0S2HXY5_9BACT|nr:hypothetical protein [Salinivirga cyanobacteriivorans]ALO14652.1 hypothetical protein L21SP5_00985 [Salinivirga cyanobacteriivorans]
MQYRNQLNKKVTEEFFDTLKELITKVVARYIARGAIPRREQADVETAIIEKFLLKQEQIDSAFQGKAKISTYYIAVINRMCAEVIRKEQKHWYSLNEHDDKKILADSTTYFDASKQTLVNEELKRFRATIMLFNGSSAKVLLFLKLYYDIPITTQEIRNYAENKTAKAQKIIEMRSELSKAELNQKLADLVLLVEGKKVGGDAVRMWINKQMDTLLCRLNGQNKSFHNKETIGLMLEMQHNSA